MNFYRDSSPQNEHSFTHPLYSCMKHKMDIHKATFKLQKHYKMWFILHVHYILSLLKSYENLCEKKKSCYSLIIYSSKGKHCERISESVKWINLISGQIFQTGSID